MEISVDLNNEVNLLKVINFKSLERTAELGIDYSFKDASRVLREINNDLIEIFKNAELLRIPTITEDKILYIARTINALVSRINSFKLKGNEANVPVQHKQILDDVNILYQKDLEDLQPLAERINVLKLKTKKIENQITKALDATKEINRLKNEAEKSKGDVDIAIKEVRDSLGKEGALISSQHFKDQSKKHKNLAKYWFMGSIVLLVLFAYLTVFLFTGFGIEEFSSLNLIKEGADYKNILQISIFRVILLSLLYLLVHQSLKNYKVNQHLYVINKHRHLALNVYPLMANASDKQEQSNIIVAQAAKAIFDQNSTGYLDGDDSKMPLNLTEVITKITDKNK